MKNSRLFVRVGLVTLLLALAQGAGALSLGRLRGAAVLGQPLELAVPLTAAADEDIAALCFGSDVYFGDSPVEASLVRVRADELVNGASTVRVSVRKAVDEPIVTVYLRSGCQTQSTRKYVLLAEFSSELAQVPASNESGKSPQPPKAVATTASPSPTLSSNPREVPAAQPGVARRGPVSTPKEPVINAQPLNVAPAPKALREPAPAETRIAKSAKGDIGRAGPRLKLQPLALSANWEPTLRLSPTLSAAPSEEVTARRTEAAALWRALNATPEELMQAAAKQTALESQLQQLESMSRNNQVAIENLQRQLQVAQEDRFTNPLVYALLFLLATGGGFAAYFWRSRRNESESPWWSVPAGARVSSPVVDPSASSDHERTGAPSNGAEQVGAGFSHAQLDLGALPSATPPVDQASAFPAAPLAAHSGPQTHPSDFSPSIIGGSLRAINTQEMVDVRQQADFFLALGQYEEAIGLLYGALHQSSDSNPHIYLDLIALLHRLARKDEYERVRQAFNALYTCHLPEFGQYASESLGLLDYPELSAPIVELWPTAAARSFIERCMVREQDDAPDAGIELTAFKDLLLLYGILSSYGEATADPSPAELPAKRELPRLRQPSAVVALGALRPKDSESMHIDLDLS